MDAKQKVLFVDAGTGFYRIAKYPVGDFFGPVDLGLHLAGRFNSLNIGVGLLAGSILPGSNRLVVTGFSPCWGGFYISSMGGAGLIFDNLGINMLSLVGKAAVALGARPQPAARRGGGRLARPGGPGARLGVGAAGRLRPARPRARPLHERFHETPRILAVGPAAQSTDFGGIVSVPIDANGALTHVDTWAGRGGFGSAPAARPQHRRDHLRRHGRGRGLPRPEGGRRVVPGPLPEAAGGEGLRGHHEVPVRPEAGDGRHAGRQLRDAGRRHAVVQLPQHLLERGGARRAPQDAGRRITT